MTNELRPLTDDEKQFALEAAAGYFGLLYDADGSPYAMGARGTGNLFTGDIEEIDDPYNRGSIYRLVKS
jgi:hypothetical protein